jgi:molecular chaperone IbpA
MVATNLRRQLSTLEPFFRTLEDTAFPLYNIYSSGNTVKIELAVAGYSRDEITVEVNPNSLIIKGCKEKELQDSSRRVLFQGITYRNFVRTFTIAKDAEVTEATLENGILSIVIEVPQKVQETKRVVIK